MAEKLSYYDALREEAKKVLLTPADLLLLLFVAALGAFYGELLNSAEPDPLSEGELGLSR
jgi:hypothetical protein